MSQRSEAAAGSSAVPIRSDCPPYQSALESALASDSALAEPPTSSNREHTTFPAQRLHGTCASEASLSEIQLQHNSAEARPLTHQLQNRRSSTRSANISRFRCNHLNCRLAAQKIGRSHR